MILHVVLFSLQQLNWNVLDHNHTVTNFTQHINKIRNRSTMKGDKSE